MLRCLSLWRQMFLLSQTAAAVCWNLFFFSFRKVILLFFCPWKMTFPSLSFGVLFKRDWVCASVALASLLLVGPPVLRHPGQPHPALSQVSLPALRCRKKLLVVIVKGCEAAFRTGCRWSPPPPTLCDPWFTNWNNKTLHNHLWGLTDVSNLHPRGVRLQWSWWQKVRVAFRIHGCHRLEDKNKKLSLWAAGTDRWGASQISYCHVTSPSWLLLKCDPSISKLVVMITWVDEAVSVTHTDFQRGGGRERTRTQQVTEHAGGGWWRLVTACTSIFVLFDDCGEPEMKNRDPCTSTPPSSSVFAGDTATVPPPHNWGPSTCRLNGELPWRSITPGLKAEM